MVTEKIESTIIIKCSKSKTNDFVKWLEDMGKKLDIEILYFTKKRLFNNVITIVMTGMEKAVVKLENKIKIKLLYG